ncbi:MAG: hypothetical protein HOM96_03855 [Rickettsiales bacterium]|jgi:hypothetical protein|nr:hypothetical protein [Rickettsiales bacterium]
MSTCGGVFIMSKEELKKALSKGQKSHITIGAAEVLSEVGKQVSEQMGGKGGGEESLAAKLVDKAADAARHAGASSHAIKSVATGSGGSLLILSGAVATFKGLSTFRNASGLCVTSESVEKALESAEIEIPDTELEDFYTSLKSELSDQGITKAGGFVKGSMRTNPEGIEKKFNDAVKNTIEKHQPNLKNKEDLISNITNSISADLGFVKIDGKMVSYAGQKGVETNAYRPEPETLVNKLGFTEEDQSKAGSFERALETSGIIENGRCVKSPTKADLQACYKMADINISDDKLKEAQGFFKEKSKAVAEVPSWNNRVNMNEKMEGGLITTMGIASVAAGVLVLVASFAGIAGLAAASFGIAVGGITATATLVARDIYKDGKEARANNQLAKTHTELAKGEKLTPKQKLEHENKAELYENKAKESGGVSIGNTLFMASIALTIMTLVIAATGGAALAGIAMATVGTFVAGAAVTVATKRIYGSKIHKASEALQEAKKNPEKPLEAEVTKAIEVSRQSEINIKKDVAEKNADNDLTKVSSKTPVAPVADSKTPINVTVAEAIDTTAQPKTQKIEPAKATPVVADTKADLVQATPVVDPTAQTKAQTATVVEEPVKVENLVSGGGGIKKELDKLHDSLLQNGVGKVDDVNSAAHSAVHSTDQHGEEVNTGRGK